MSHTDTRYRFQEISPLEDCQAEEEEVYGRVILKK